MGRRHRFKTGGGAASLVAGDDTLDETDERVFAYIKQYDFVKFPWSTEEAAAELNLEATRVRLDDADMAALDTAFPIGCAAGLRYPEAGMASLSREAPLRGS